MPETERRHLLILGGTAEARDLAAAALDRFGSLLAVTTALAGRTQAPAPVRGEVRSGGFGGAAGLEEFLRSARVDLLIDATHPFAVRISAAARLACARAGVARAQLARPPWLRHKQDRWIEVADAAAAAAALRSLGRRVFLTIGAREIAAFADLADMHFLVRLVDAPPAPLPLASYELVVGRGPFALAAERALLTRHRIEVLVSKASGGNATAAKLIAAREAGLPVVMLARPAAEPGQSVVDVEGAVTWLAARLDEMGSR
jgi:precorrin-6A/cobalt-precorrin-6A reductase